MSELLSHDEVRAIARLARLALTDDEVESLRGDLSAILAHMDALRALDTEGVPPMTHAVPMPLHVRDDRVEPSLPVNTVLGQAPEHAGGHFQVPHIIDTNQAE